MRVSSLLFAITLTLATASVSALDSDLVPTTAPPTTTHVDISTTDGGDKTHAVKARRGASIELTDTTASLTTPSPSTGSIAPEGTGRAVKVETSNAPITQAAAAGVHRFVASTSLGSIIAAHLLA